MNWKLGVQPSKSFKKLLNNTLSKVNTFNEISLLTHLYNKYMQSFNKSCAWKCTTNNITLKRVILFQTDTCFRIYLKNIILKRKLWKLWTLSLHIDPIKFDECKPNIKQLRSYLIFPMKILKKLRKPTQRRRGHTSFVHKIYYAVYCKSNSFFKSWNIVNYEFALNLGQTFRNLTKKNYFWPFK